MPKIIPVETIEHIRNKVTELNNQVTDEQYPSAKAIYTALQNIEPDGSSKISVWQPNTEYKVGDVCYWNHLANEYAGYSAFLECKTNHTSNQYDPLLELDKWTVLKISADRSTHDAYGKVIHETYATKEELAEAIGQALEGDY